MSTLLANNIYGATMGDAPPSPNGICTPNINGGYVAIIGPSLGLTEQQIDDLFFLAATL